MAMAEATIDAVLPLAKSDLERFERLLFPSLQRFFGILGTCWIVTPAREAVSLSKTIKDDRFLVLPETDLIPELTSYRRLLRDVGAATGAGSGWFIQQLIKLAIAKRVSSAFYLTLDADILCVREARYTDLVRDGRATAVVYRSDKDVHGGWYWWTEKVLGFPRSGRTHGVTPAVLSVEAVNRLFDYLHSRVKEKGLTIEAYLLKKLPWTEYTLYYSFLEHMELFDRYHFQASMPLSGNCLWHASDFPGWRPENSFFSKQGYLFSVIQTDAAPSIEEVVRLVQPYFA
jgi:hypothetical protein